MDLQNLTGYADEKEDKLNDYPLETLGNTMDESRLSTK